MKARIVFGLFAILLLHTFLTYPVQSRPSFAINRNNNCFACHTNTQTGRMRVVPTGLLTDLGTQLDGSDDGALKTYRVSPGETVSLKVEVLNGNSRFAVQLKNLDEGGQKNSRSNMIFWSEANSGDNNWNRREGRTPYFTKNRGSNSGISGSETPITYTFDLHVDVDTPLDTYELTFATAGQSGFWYQQETFYLEVFCPFEMAGDLNEDCRIDFHDFAILSSAWLVDCIQDPNHPACVD